MRRSLWLPMAAAFLLPLSVVAAEAEVERPVTLPEALARALANHPELAAAAREIEAADGALVQAAARPNPSLEAEVIDTRRATRETTIALAQPFELGGKRPARIRAAERARDVAVVQLAARRAEVRAAASAAFFEVLAAQERVSLAEAALAIAQGGSTAAAQRVIAGKISPVEETKAKVAEAGVRVELLQARSALRVARVALAAALGTEARIERVDGSVGLLPAAAVDASLADRLAASPAMTQARLEVERLDALAELERARRLPDLTLTVGARRAEELGRTQATIGISIPLPVFDTNRGAQLEALRRRDRARAEAEALLLRLRADVLGAYEKLDAARAEATALQQEVLPGAQGAYDAAAKGFALGKFGFLDVLDAQRTLLAAKSQHLRALAETHRVAADIDRLLGDDRTQP